jgi:hypothetical protein
MWCIGAGIARRSLSLLPQPGGLEGRFQILSPLEPGDVALPKTPAMGLLLHKLAFASSAARIPAHSGDDDVPTVEELVELMPGLLPDLSESPHRSYHFSGAAPNAWFDCIWGIDVFDIRSGQFEEPYRIFIDQPLVIDAPRTISTFSCDIARQYPARAASRESHGCQE